MLSRKKMASAFSNDALSNLDGVGIAQAIESKSISAMDAVEASIKRAEYINPTINAIALESYDRARENAKDRDNAKREGSSLSSLMAGVPIFTKDNECVVGEPLSFGSRAMPFVKAAGSGDVVNLNTSIGLISLGKSTMPEFGLTATTESLLHKPTLNPWNIDCSPGGSSGGAAALVAAGVVPIAHANDGGGSIRIPAACCGLVGLKPSRDRLGIQRSSKLIPIKLFTQGVLSRSVRDTAFYYAMAEHHYRNTALPEIGRVDRPGKERLKIGMFTKLDDDFPSNNDVAQCVLDTGALCEELGHSVELIENPFDQRTFDDFVIYWCMLAFYTKHLSKKLIGVEVDKDKLEPFTLSLCQHFVKKGLTLPLVIQRLHILVRDYEKVLSKYDVLLTPTTGSPAPKIGCLNSNRTLSEQYSVLKQFVPFCCIQNVTGAPAISLPMGFSVSKKLPIGVQFAAALGQDSRLLALAYELEKAKPWLTIQQMKTYGE